MFNLPKLSYAYDALEPFIDAKTMEIHHSKHHQTYCDKFNEVLKDTPEYFEKTPEEILINLDKVPENIREWVKNFGGGFINHNLFWEVIGIQTNKWPTGKLAEAITRDFGGLSEFKEKMNKSALSQFGSGWAWLVKNKEGVLSIINLPNQDSPLSRGLMPILCIDVWEHAYYLKYQNKRADYVENWWHVINWSAVEALFEK